MFRQGSYIFLLTGVILLLQLCAFSQQPVNTSDTFFLAKKKGLLGRFGKIISSNNSPEITPQKLVNNFADFKGKTIRFIEVIGLGFECNIYDSCDIKDNFGIRVAKRFHKNTREPIIYRNLFFKEGQKLSPYLLADNERYLRELVFLQDARILVDNVEGSKDSVDVIVLTKDVFSMGGKVVIDSKEKGRLEWKEENFNGSGSRVMLSGFYDKQRSPQTGYGAEVVQRNIGGSFIDLTAGFRNYKQAFSSGRSEEMNIYAGIEKPLVTPYIPSTGALQASYSKTTNAYVADSLYRSDFRYEFYNIDGWLGYSLDSRRYLYANKEIKLHRFVALRVFNQRFISLPSKIKSNYDYRYTNFTGTLASLNIFKQTFYKTNFIYGFGRSEDIPEGFSVAFTAGFINKANIRRPYTGIDAELTSFKRKGFHSNFTFRAGGYYYKSRFEDVDLLFQVEHFTRLRKLAPTWFLRSFITTGITAQANPVLNAPLFLNSIYGLDYFQNGNIRADLRATVKGESVFYNTKKLLGFRFAPFVFADLSLVKPLKTGLEKTELYSALGGGIRTRNENLIFGTIELKGYYFPRTIDAMKNWKVELSSNIRFKYKTGFIKRPDFIIAN